MGLVTAYSPLHGVAWSHCESQSFDSDDTYRVNYTYCTTAGEITSDFVATYLRLSSGLVMGYIRQLGLKPNPCRQNTNLEVYEVTMNVLNDHQRFTEWQAQSPAGITIWALYDARVPEQSVSSIMMTHHEGWDQINLAHEVSHYWYDRFCLGAQYSYQIEPFAKGFEDYFKSIMNR